ncbi:MAG: hypothetical protein M4579_002419 [Chaenotheca gracillima]|nr:MAG: hypothetical protein M4579_002419 [Chaenotheca gracillima]
MNPTASEEQEFDSQLIIDNLSTFILPLRALSQDKKIRANDRRPSNRLDRYPTSKTPSRHPQHPFTSAILLNSSRSRPSPLGDPLRRVSRPQEEGVTPRSPRPVGQQDLVHIAVRHRAVQQILAAEADPQRTLPTSSNSHTGANGAIGEDCSPRRGNVPLSGSAFLPLRVVRVHDCSQEAKRAVAAHGQVQDLLLRGAIPRSDATGRRAPAAVLTSWDECDPAELEIVKRHPKHHLVAMSGNARLVSVFPTGISTALRLLNRRRLAEGPSSWVES